MPNKEAELDKEAKEYRKENLCKKCHKHCKEGMCTCSECKIKTFKDGAEFGYNKANEWHYPSKGEYPEEREDVLCYCEVVGVKFYNVGHTVIGGDNKIRWWSSNRSEELKVYAWKEITPPKEIK